VLYSASVSLVELANKVSRQINVAARDTSSAYVQQSWIEYRAILDELVDDALKEDSSYTESIQIKHADSAPVSGRRRPAILSTPQTVPADHATQAVGFAEPSEEDSEADAKEDVAADEEEAGQGIAQAEAPQ
jgi:hypothetical protein